MSQVGYGKITNITVTPKEELEGLSIGKNYAPTMWTKVNDNGQQIPVHLLIVDDNGKEGLFPLSALEEVK